MLCLTPSFQARNPSCSKTQFNGKIAILCLTCSKRIKRSYTIGLLIMKNCIKFRKSFYYMHINLESYSQQLKLMNLLHTTKIVLYFKSHKKKK